MDEPLIGRDQLLDQIPPRPAISYTATLQNLIRRINRKVIVLDDDPTGTQTVHDIPVVTHWTVEHLARELADPAPVSYVLTNSRSLPSDAAVALNHEIARNLCLARQRTGRDFTLISRSDSTLRGHFPAELDALAAGLDDSFDAWVLCPFFEEGGRLTVDDVHYVAEADQLTPAARTPFADDLVFGYRNSNLRDWVVEKSLGRVPPERIESLSLADLRDRDLSTALQKLRKLTTGSLCIVNAVERFDLEAAMTAILRAEIEGKRFLYRTAASFVAVRAGIDRQPLLTADALVSETGHGVLIVVGSYVPKTTTQLHHLFQFGNVVPVELNAHSVLDPATQKAMVKDIAARVSDQLADESAVVVYTSRELVPTVVSQSLTVGQMISQALVDVVRSISVRPRILIAKGGITSSDIATKACGVQRALVMGQALPGIPVWQCGPESHFPELPLVVFPGNVGDVDALTTLVKTCHASTKPSRGPQR
jgi:uncharacterized protein YgbK (DUF1537 family)